jgi:outer membrane protein assembly factor BamB
VIPPPAATRGTGPLSIRPFTLLACLVLWTATASAEDWPQWRGVRGDGSWNAPRIPETWPADGLKVRWKHPIGGGYSGIVTSRGRCITLDRQKEPEEVERVLCQDEKTGDLLWQHSYPVAYEKLDYGNGPRSAATIVGDKVYTTGALGHCFCLDFESGKVLWEKQFRRDFHGRMPMWGYAASPRVVGELVILQPGGADGWSIVALNRLTGEVVWHSLSDEAGYTWPAIEDRRDHRLCVCWTPSHIRGLDLDTGRPLWGIPYEVQYGVSIATPIIHRDTVLVCGYWDGSRAIRLGPTPESAELAWSENKFLRGLMAQPLLRDDHVYLLDKVYGLTCFEFATGKKLWDDKNAMTPRDRNPHASYVWLGDTDRILSLNAEGDLIYARITPDGYHEFARTKIIGHTWAHPAFSNDAVIARTDEEIVCVELPGDSSQ